jgi:hypothetical protein
MEIVRGLGAAICSEDWKLRWLECGRSVDLFGLSRFIWFCLIQWVLWAFQRRGNKLKRTEAGCYE